VSVFLVAGKGQLFVLRRYVENMTSIFHFFR